MPYKLVPKIRNEDVDAFLNGWEDNRVRGLIFEPRQNMRLRYLVTAYHFRHRVAFG
jgi:DnaJ family protein C protein 16